MARGIYVHIRASLLAVTLSAPKLHKLVFSSTCGLKSLTNPALDDLLGQISCKFNGKISVMNTTMFLPLTNG